MPKDWPKLNPILAEKGIELLSMIRTELVHEVVDLFQLGVAEDFFYELAW